MKKIIIVLLAMMAVICADAQKKREFRGAWIQCVNGQFQGMSTQKMQQTLAYQLDELQQTGVNAIFFQVRPECDALYQSGIEPWSRFLTGRQGKAPSPYWDPLQWMIDQCHKRGMELHAWINPFRAKTKGTVELASNHVAVKNPEKVFEYDGLLILNPGLPENRKYICDVVADIVKRYDIDGLHIDDYFYPYPSAGHVIPDVALFKSTSNGFSSIGDWRRHNVNLYMQMMQETIKSIKPWVKFGVSPFGIYRNKKNSDIGSNTNGLQNYDDLYADILMWVNNGWVDYTVPQIYWQIGHSAADYTTLIKWWNQYAAGRPLFIGEDVERTVKYADPNNPNTHQQAAKYELHRKMANVNGAVLWYAKAAVDNVGNYSTMLRNHFWKYPALQPSMPFIDGKAPGKVKKLKPIWMEDGYVLFWTAPKGNNWNDMAVKYVVYRFNKGEKVNIADASKIVAITTNTFYKLPYNDGKTKYKYVVTALDRMQNESKAKSRRVRL